MSPMKNTSPAREKHGHLNRRPGPRGPADSADAVPWEAEAVEASEDVESQVAGRIERTGVAVLTAAATPIPSGTE